MAKSKPTMLGKFELEIMHVIWNKGKATVHEIKDGLSEKHPAAYTTFLTMMQRMERKGLVAHEIHKDGKSYVYKPLVSRELVSVSMFQDVYDRLFHGSSERLLSMLNTFFRDEKMTPEEIQRLRELIAEEGEQDE
ncbi:BlaI/MecI/CopY family transcriptional regulator [Candidatus Poribacteria bacterium]